MVGRFRFETVKSITGEPDFAVLTAQLAANVAEIARLRAEREALCRRGVKLEEEITVAKLHLHSSYSRTGMKFVAMACRAKRSRLPIWTMA